MGLGDMINKGKDALSNITGDEKKSDELLDKGENFANDKFAGHEDKVGKVRDTLDDKIGE
ncbi:Rv0909 family putative TA system antitoxin [Cumulibacter soli]|uniref:Rv0909 family putative TA system antitoxin n=1 Tax=Cumulibacter soli TaxID=2546344 RepID=UPI001068C8C2|nr:Rv0909 family putative TA system antitoxin [Cumulibacter soli]